MLKGNDLINFVTKSNKVYSQKTKNAVDFTNTMLRTEDNILTGLTIDGK